MDMKRNTFDFQEILPMPLIFRFRKLLCRSSSLFGPSAVALIFCLNACANLAAQQAEADHPGPAALVATAADVPAPEPAPEAAAAPPQSSSASGSAPQTQPVQNSQGNASGQQTKRILGIVPNFRAVSVDVKLPPETIKDKFIGATEDSFDYSSVFFPAAIAAYNMGERATPEFHQGAAGYARYFWHSAIDQTSENYMVEFIYPTITHEDARYYTLERGGFFKRTGYALSRAVVTRSNSGAEVFNVSEIFGAGTAAGISNLYYPSASRSLGNTVSEWVEDVGIDAGCFWFREFWPDINRHIFHNKYSDAPAQK
jgi:hypothetical protein